jgi:hypothetical protein
VQTVTIIPSTPTNATTFPSIIDITLDGKINQLEIIGTDRKNK